ncbi:DIS3-like exonuclease 2, partial [Dissostichus eleginoides]
PRGCRAKWFLSEGGHPPGMVLGTNTAAAFPLLYPSVGFGPLLWTTAQIWPGFSSAAVGGSVGWHLAGKKPPLGTHIPPSGHVVEEWEGGLFVSSSGRQKDHSDLLHEHPTDRTPEAKIDSSIRVCSRLKA